LKEERQILGDNVIPVKYLLEFELNLKRFIYKCDETISIKINKPTKTIKLNSVNLKIKNVSLVSNRKSQKATINTEKKIEQIALNFGNAVSGNAELKIEFEGKNEDKLGGFYRSSYDVGKKKEYLVTTQFEPADARKAFPCFDEPAMKASFELSFTIDKDLDVISNMPKASTKVVGKKKLIRFQSTPVMSPYLLYMGVGRFERLKGKYGKKDFDVITAPGKIKLGETALEYGKKFMKYYENYFGIKYPLPKMDLLAIPDFAIAGMENWGAITYSEIALLTDKKATSVVAKQRIAEVVAHELAHQWFGDLVTMKWWDNLWLNESFAMFMSYKALDAVFPKWQMGLQAVLGRSAYAMGADQLRSTQAIGINVNTPGDMAEAFDPAITYSKGSSVLTMLEDYVGENAFRQGLRRYMKKYSYSNATEHDLWNSIGGLDKIASYWINKAGYPVVNVESHNEELELSQKRFLLLDKEDKGVWPIPVHYIEKGKVKQHKQLLLDKKRKSVKTAKDLDYIKVNYMQKGFYRVNYSKSMLNRLGEAIKRKEIGGLDGWGIEGDLYNNTRACKIKVNDYLDFVDKYCFDCEYPLNQSLSNHLSGLYSIFKNDGKLGSKIKDISMRYYNKILKDLGWKKGDNESNTDTIMRTSAILNLGILGDKIVIAKIKVMFDNYINQKVPIDTDIRTVAYKISARVGSESTLDRFINLYKNEQIPEEKIRFMHAIGSVIEPKQVDKAFAFVLSGNVRMQYLDYIPTFLSSEDYGEKILLGWVKTNWKRFMGMFEAGGPGGLDDFVDLLSIYDDQKRRDEIAAFFKKKENYRNDIKRSIVKTLEYIDINIRFKKFNSK
jgi:tricorn protease interacting factor F2/3